MKPYHENIKQQARRMHQQGMPQKQIAKSLHVPYSTIWRWTNDAYAERQRQASRAQKHKYRGTCIDCGTSTSYSGKGTQGSARCDPCYRKHMSYNRKWNQQNVIAAIHRWTAEHGQRPTPTDWIHAGPYWPSCTFIYQPPNPIFPKWSDALRAAGHTNIKRCPGPGNQLFSRDEALQLRQHLTDKQIAAHYGVTSQAIHHALGPRYKTGHGKPQPKPQPKLTAQQKRQQAINNLNKALVNQKGKN